MKVSGCFPSKYLKAADIPDGVEAQVQIEAMQIEEVGREKEPTPVLYFAGKNKGLCLNKTNANVLTTAFGDESDNWKGKTIAIFSTVTDFAGRQVPCLRVKVPRQQQVAAAIAAPVASNPDATDNCPF